jgi:hypothetical protein
MAIAASPVTAQAGVVSRCTGSVVASKPVLNRLGEQIGRVELWYKSDNGGTNCVMTWNYLGKVAGLNATLRDDRDGRVQQAPGRFATYSDGAQLTSTNGHCVSGSGSVSGSNTLEVGTASIPSGHCG